MRRICVWVTIIMAAFGVYSVTQTHILRITQMPVYRHKLAFWSLDNALFCWLVCGGFPTSTSGWSCPYSVVHVRNGTPYALAKALPISRAWFPFRIFRPSSSHNHSSFDHTQINRWWGYGLRTNRNPNTNRLSICIGFWSGPMILFGSVGRSVISSTWFCPPSTPRGCRYALCFASHSLDLRCESPCPRKKRAVFHI